VSLRGASDWHICPNCKQPCGSCCSCGSCT
jgi:hypothetical protein